MYYVEGTNIFKLSQPLEGISASQHPPPLANFKNCSTDFCRSKHLVGPPLSELPLGAGRVIGAAVGSMVGHCGISPWCKGDQTG